MKPAPRPPVRLRSYALAFGLLALFLIIAHGSLLKLPFYWDEAGQFIPAALDIFRLGAWIPVSTVPNVHPPGLMAFLAGLWSVFGFSIAATRIAMLLIAAFGALFTFLLGIELARGAAGTPAFAALAFLCFSPLFFAQSMLAQLDMPAMCLSTLALLLFLQNRFRASAIACATLVAIKETGVVAPVVFGCWLLFESGRSRRERRQSLWFALPLPGLMFWLAALHHATGHWFGDAAFTAYNVWQPLHPARFAFALVRRLYYLFAGSGHLIGTIALIWALGRMPLLRDRPWRVAASFAAAHVVAVSALGGAVLERYLLPVLPIVYIAFAVALQALLPRTRRFVFVALLLSLIAANLINPVYPFPFENNLEFISFVDLAKTAALYVESRPGSIATAFPIAEALRDPAFGYVETPRQVISITDFTQPEIEKLRPQKSATIVVFTRTWDPLHILRYPIVARFLRHEYGYQPEMRPESIAETLQMRIARQWTQRGLTFSVLVQQDALTPVLLR
jgi:4-amino-4-deoxy-L-arabinose transferase-like glycosyltransferase